MIKSVHLSDAGAKWRTPTEAQERLLADAAALGELAREIQGRANRLSCYRAHLPEVVALGWLGHAIWKAGALVLRAREDGGVLVVRDLSGPDEATSALVLRPVAEVIDLAPHLARRTTPR